MVLTDHLISLTLGIFSHAPRKWPVGSGVLPAHPVRDSNPTTPLLAPLSLHRADEDGGGKKKMMVALPLPNFLQEQRKRKQALLEQERSRSALRRNFLHRTVIWELGVGWRGNRGLDIKGSLSRSQFAHLANGTIVASAVRPEGGQEAEGGFKRPTRVKTCAARSLAPWE